MGNKINGQIFVEVTQNFKYGGHAATLLVYFIFRGARAEDRTRDCLTAARHATCGLRRHPNVGYVATLVGYVATLMGYVATFVGYVATLVGYVATLVGYVATLMWATSPP